MRAWLAFSTVLVLLAAFVLLGRAGRTTIAETSPALSIPTPASAESPPWHPASRRAAATPRPLAFEDRLTGASLDLEVELRTGQAEAPVELRAGDSFVLGDAPADALLRYSLADGSEFSARLEECLRESEDRWRLALPYTGRIRIVPPPLGTLPEGSAFLRLFRPGAAGADSPAIPADGPFSAPATDRTGLGELIWNLRAQQTPVLAAGEFDEGMPLGLDYAGVGPVVLLAHHGSGALGWAATELTPGEERTVMPEYVQRPRIEGRLLDEDGEPVADVKIMLAVSLDLADYDLLPEDPYGFVALDTGTEMFHRAGTSTRTDAQGRFQFLAPRGRATLVYAYARGACASWCSLDHGGGVRDGLEIELCLDAASRQDNAEFEIRRPDGLPLRGGRLEIVGVGDQPFFRKWPDDLWLDDEGVVRVPAIRLGARFAGVVYHPDLVNGSCALPAFAPDPSRRMSFELPAARLAAAAKPEEPPSTDHSPR